MRRFQLNCFFRSAVLTIFGTVVMAALPVFVQSNQAADLAQHMASQAATAGSTSEIVLPEDRLVVGMVEQVKDNEIRVNTGELMPRFLPLNEARQDKVRPLVKGDLIEIWVNSQDLVVDYHPLDTLGWHRIIRGTLVQPLVVDQEWAVIKPVKGKEEAYAVRPLARSKVAALPVGAQALFLLDKVQKIVDATFGDQEALDRATQGWHGSPPKGVDRASKGIILHPLTGNRIRIQKPDGRQETYEVRAFMKDKLARLENGTQVILMIDNEKKVTDLAVP
ncbi:MAG TPA: hypothetical protein VGJ57_01695 [Nitrospirales bacterium]|jgi:hypothetical protein